MWYRRRTWRCGQLVFYSQRGSAGRSSCCSVGCLIRSDTHTHTHTLQTLTHGCEWRGYIEPSCGSWGQKTIPAYFQWRSCLHTVPHAGPLLQPTQFNCAGNPQTPLTKTLNSETCCIGTNFLNFVKRWLWWILNCLNILVNSANVTAKIVSFFYLKRMFVQQGSEIQSQNITGDTSWFNFDFCVHQDFYLMAACRYYCWSLQADIRLVDWQLRWHSPVSAADVNLLYLIHFTLGTRVVWPHLSVGLQPLLSPRLRQHAVHTCGLFSNASERQMPACLRER